MTQIRIERTRPGNVARETITVTVKNGFSFRVVVIADSFVFLHGAEANNKLRLGGANKTIVDDTVSIAASNQ